MWAVLAPFALPTWTIPILIMVMVLAGVAARLGRPFVRSVAIGSFVIGAPILLLNGLVFPGARDVIAALGPLALTREGLDFALPIAGRLVVALAAVTAFVLATRPDDLMEALIERGASTRLAYVLLVAMQAIPRLGRRAERIVDAARTRGLRTSGSLRARAAALGPVAGALALATLIDVRDRTLALESRAFSSGRPRTAFRRPRWRRRDTVATTFAVALLVALVIVAGLRVTGVAAALG